MMKNKMVFLGLLAGAAGSAVAHGWQTSPLSRAEYLRETDIAAVGWEPQSIASNLTANGGYSYQQISGFSGGPLGFFKAYHAIQDKNLCDNGHTNWSKLLNSLPNDKVIKMANGDTAAFSWTKTAAHTPSNHFEFITNYAPGAYNPTPTWKDLHYISGCDKAAGDTSPTTWNCKIQLANQTLQGKQVLVSVWQRVDAAGENFVSCSDVDFSGGSTPVTPTWNAIDGKSWILKITQPKANELVTFSITKNGTTLASYPLSVTSNNVGTWDSILAAKVNTDTSHNNLVAIGVLNTSTGTVTYDAADQSKDYVYLNKGVAESGISYAYTLTKVNDPNPVTIGWGALGLPLKDWLNTIKTGDKLSFSLNKNGVETDTFDAMTVATVASAEKDLAAAINAHTFKNSVQIKAGVQNGSSVTFTAGGANKVYVYKSSDSTDAWSYVIRNSSTVVKYKYAYPTGKGSYLAGDIVKSTNGSLYKCKIAGWCNGVDWAYAPGTGSYSSDAWDGYEASNTPDPVIPAGTKVYPAGKPYAVGSIVADATGATYKCTVAPWCNGSETYYSPGNGLAWQSAWTKQ